MMLLLMTMPPIISAMITSTIDSSINVKPCERCGVEHRMKWGHFFIAYSIGQKGKKLVTVMAGKFLLLLYRLDIRRRSLHSAYIHVDWPLEKMGANECLTECPVLKKNASRKA